MCGIAGIVGGGISNKAVRVEAMLRSMKHRGPNHSGVNDLGDQIFFGHNRLSIIDLNSTSNQPFVSSDKRFTLVFNGEIYNYRELKECLKTDFEFRTNSDTEVLMAAYQKWGTECLGRLVGMFSFAFWDNHEKVFFAARDRFGVKPMYYGEHDGSFVFASEIKALWAVGVPRERNDKVWASYLVYGDYGMPQETFWKTIYQLPGGCYLLMTGTGKVEVRRWYSFEDRVKTIQSGLAVMDEDSISEQYLSLLNESVKLRFRSDVPVGFNVSGGVDSSILLALIKQLFPRNSDIHAFTFYTGNANYDELPWVRALIDSTAYPLNAIQLTAEHVPELAEEMAIHQDEPFGGLPTLAYALLFKAAHSQNTIVLLDGQGIDEAWAGYDYYQKTTNEVVQGLSDSPVRPNVLMKEFRDLAEKPRYVAPFDDRVLNLQYRDLFFTKIPRALRFNDRISMKYSTELREPFLDHRLVEMAFSLPNEFKIRDGNGKYLLRKISKTLLPESIRLAPKRPVQTPQREWLAKDLQQWADHHITAFAKRPEINTAALLNEWHQYLLKRPDNSFYIWQWINSNLLMCD